jgi:hypothetical protein
VQARAAGPRKSKIPFKFCAKLPFTTTMSHPAARFSAHTLIAEMLKDNVKPASTYESGWYWRSVDGRMYWVTAC